MTTSMKGRLTTAENAMRFVTGGNATLTARSAKTSNRFTFKVSAPKDKTTGKREETAKRFVSVMIGSDNENDFTYLGMVSEDGSFRATRATTNPGGMAFKAFDWVWKRLRAGNLPESLELWHEGKCARCGKKLTTPESIEAGVGPECLRKSLDQHTMQTQMPLAPRQGLLL